MRDVARKRLAARATTYVRDPPVVAGLSDGDGSNVPQWCWASR
jgi:hypothetical protein